MAGYYKDVREIEAVVEGFESCTTGKDDFTHRSHLTVAAYYLYSNNERDATETMKIGLLRFLDHHGVGRAKFHETLTVFWIKSVLACLQRLEQKLALVPITNEVLESLGDSRLVFSYYSEELLQTDRARTVWVAPDLRDL